MYRTLQEAGQDTSLISQEEILPWRFFRKHCAIHKIPSNCSLRNTIQDGLSEFFLVCMHVWEVSQSSGVLFIFMVSHFFCLTEVYLCFPLSTQPNRLISESQSFCCEFSDFMRGLKNTSDALLHAAVLKEHITVSAIRSSCSNCSTEFSVNSAKRSTFVCLFVCFSGTYKLLLSSGIVIRQDAESPSS